MITIYGKILYWFTAMFLSPALWTLINFMTKKDEDQSLTEYYFL